MPQDAPPNGSAQEFCRYLRSLYPSQVRIALICDNYSPHLTTRRQAGRDLGGGE